jgi:hypothetical protein
MSPPRRKHLASPTKLDGAPHRGVGPNGAGHTGEHMKTTSLLLSFAALVAIACLPTNSAHAQSFRTFVSGMGSDANSCTRTAPCRTFAHAISKTVAGGEINCLDPADYAEGLNIRTAITIDCTGTHAGVYGVVINSRATDKVTLRGISFNGAGFGAASSGYSLFFRAGAHLHVENATFENGGISVETAGLSILTVRNASFIRGPTGVRLLSTAPNVVASISDSKFDNLSNGVEVGANSYAAISSSVFGALGGSAILASTATSTVYADNNVISNTWTGLNASVAGAKITARANNIYGNSKAFNVAAGATLLSDGNNKFDINPGSPATGTLGSK